MSASERVAVGAALPGDLASRLDRAFGLALEIGTALLVAAEIAILFVGIVARYAFHRPLIWSDELASLLFLWLAMFGAVLALRRGEHMRMTALVNAFPLRSRYFFELLSLAAALAFLGAILLPAFDYAAGESIVSIMSLDISMSWRAAAMPVCVGLLALTVLLRILAQPRPATLLALIVVAAIIGGFALLHPTLLTLGRGNLVVFFLGVVAVTVFAGIPIAVSFGLATLGYLAFATHVPIAVLVARMDSGMSHPVLLSVPLFVFLGLLIEMTGMAQVMVRFLANLLGHVRGGLSFVLIGAMYLVLRHLRLEGRRHGRGRAGAVPRDGAARRGARRSGGAAGGDRGADRDHPAQPDPDHHRLGHQHLDRGAVHRRPAAGSGGRTDPVPGGRAPRTQGGSRHAAARRGARDRPQLPDRDPRAGAAVRDPRRRGGRCRDGNRGLHHRHRLFGGGRPADLPKVRCRAIAADAGADRVAHRRDPADRRRRDRRWPGRSPRPASPVSSPAGSR